MRPYIDAQTDETLTAWIHSTLDHAYRCALDADRPAWQRRRRARRCCETAGLYIDELTRRDGKPRPRLRELVHAVDDLIDRPDRPAPPTLLDVDGNGKR